MLASRLLDFVGIDPGRFHTRWISGSEGPKFQEVVTEITEQIRALGPNRKLKDDFDIEFALAQIGAQEVGEQQ